MHAFDDSVESGSGVIDIVVNGLVVILVVVFKWPVSFSKSNELTILLLLLLLFEHSTIQKIILLQN